MANTSPASKLVAARYIGDYPVLLSRQHGPIHNDAGERIDGTLIGKGDIVLLPAAEVLGQTYWHDPRHHLPSLYIGVGAVVRPEHAGMKRAELQAIGYDFHEGRSDFEAVNVAPAQPQATQSAPQPMAESVTLPDAVVVASDDTDTAPAPAPAIAMGATPVATEPAEPAGETPAEGD